MHVAVLGAGRVGTTLGGRLAKAGHTILYAVREPDASKHDALRAAGWQVLSVRDAVAHADAIILSTPWAAAQSALASAGDFAGKPLLDATNPIGPGLQLTHGHTDSGGEQVQRWAPTACVVKVFHSTGMENMAEPVYPDGPLSMFLCGDDARSLEIAQALCADVGFEPLVVGGLDQARLLEPFAMLWIRMAMVRGYGRDFGLTMVKRQPQA